ncbi:ubiquitin-like protein Pup [Nanchangia anserum]|uniref:Prokaryotic ubiquitin-like protein Pup n=1 Tax=Nanchangia anserum TaxID=2692125 RepID=A0A8I0KMX8_9ACTO|nr:ubiquitin-like protein Pup [Nanchangia anserum]MBD3688686.1 ubiquitin-like protein Pup [Nanchangia anserum]QOX82436.1 ubiquitin-like protein Pup [Nanchangia anserum]
MSQEQISAGGAPAGDEDTGSAGGQAMVTPGIDALLDQIDEVLASDAQAFVQGFVQKGGQ